MLKFFMALVFSMASFPSAALEIQNFRAGLACINPSLEMKDFGASGICVDTEIIPITGQSVCVFDGQELPCTWYGFEFDYRDFGDGEKITCASTSSKPGTIGNPKAIDAEDVTTFNYTIKVKGDSGRYFNPQFSIYRSAPQDEHIINDTVCRVGERELFKFRQQIVYPAVRGSSEIAGVKK